MKQAMALYGAGQKSLQAEARLRHHCPEIDVRWLVENRDFSKLGQSVPRLDGEGQPLEVISLAGLRRLHEDRACDSILIPCGYHLFDLREARLFSEQAGFDPKDILAMPPNCLFAPLEQSWQPQEVALPFDDLNMIYSLDVHIVDHCNCNCRACAHFAPCVTGDVTYAADEVTRSLQRLADLVPNVVNLWILGGEPLLHPELATIVRNARQYFPWTNIGVVTNGILLPQLPTATAAVMRENNVSMIVSLYPPLHDRVDCIVNILHKHELRWSITRCDRFEKRIYNKKIAPREHGFVKCGHNMCLRGSRVGYCVMALFTDYFNARFGNLLPEDKGVDIFAVHDGHELLTALHRPLQLCSQCTSCDAGQRYTVPWLPAGTNPDPSDWYISANPY